MGDLGSVTFHCSKEIIFTILEEILLKEKKNIYLHIIIIGTLHAGSDTLEKKNFLRFFDGSVACKQI